MFIFTRLFKKIKERWGRFKDNYFKIFTFNHYLSKYTGFIIILLFLNFIYMVLNTVQPYFTKILIDTVIPHKDWKLFIIIFTMAGLIVLLSLTFSAISSYIKTFINEKIKLKIEHQLQKASAGATYDALQGRGSGEHIYRFNADVQTVARTITDIFPLIIVNLLQLVISLVITIKLNYKLTLLYLLIIPVNFLLEIVKDNKMRPLHILRNSIGQLKNNFLSQFIEGFLTIKIYGSESLENRRFYKILRESYSLAIKQWKKNTFYNFISNLTSRGWELFVLLVGWIMVMREGLSIGTLVALQLYLVSLVKPIQTLFSLFHQLMNSSIATDRINETLKCEKEPLNLSKELSLIKERGITFESVDFAYGNGKKVLKNVSLNFPSGQIVGITGPSGVGKTTLVNLIAGIYSSQRGRILFSGQDIDQVSPQTVRRSISYVQQKSFIFNSTIEENILYGSRNKDFSDVVDAAKIASAHDFIQSLPEGYKTQFSGNSNRHLSEGQKQRISLARALLRDTPILILDEFSVGLDAVSEEAIINNIHQKYSDKTIILISHKVCQLMYTHKVVVLFDGSVVQSGSPAELLEEEGLFKRLYSLQSKFLNNKLFDEYEVLEKELL